MAKSGQKKGEKVSNPIFEKYKNELVKDPAFAGMPDLRYPDGHIQWEAPSNRKGGQFKDSHDMRLQWWKDKAAEVGISISEDKWISKVAKKIHPTGKRPCPVCGRVLEIRYAYLSKKFMNRVKKLAFYNDDIEMSEITHIFDFVTEFVSLYGDNAYAALPSLLKCTEVNTIKTLPNDLDTWLDWLGKEYITKEPDMLGPGSMSNAPDRLDGFHYNRCCRKSKDKGRSDENMALYSKDRRAFENWSDGNWLTANMLMGFINSDANIKNEPCANEGDGQDHSRPCSADHIGPISLGFCHRPEFQLLCKSCNSTKNNRIYFSDVQHLKEVEASGEVVTSWYAMPVWNRCKNNAVDTDTALRLYRIMRDNRNVALMLLSDFMVANECLFLYSYLNLEYADFQYNIIPGSTKIDKHIVTVDFSKNKSALRYVTIQKRRKIRVAFESLTDYANKENRNGFMYTNPEVEHIRQSTLDLLQTVPDEYKSLNLKLNEIIKAEKSSDIEVDNFIATCDYRAIQTLPQFVVSKKNLLHIMELVATELSSNWGDSRYAREIEKD